MAITATDYDTNLNRGAAELAHSVAHSQSRILWFASPHRDQDPRCNLGKNAGLRPLFSELFSHECIARTHQQPCVRLPTPVLHGRNCQLVIHSDVALCSTP